MKFLLEHPALKPVLGHPLAQRVIPLVPWRFVKFGIVGTGGFVTDVIMLKAFVYSGMNDYWGQVPAFLCATVFTWMANRFWTFNDRRSGVHIGKEWLRYLAVTTAGFCINYAGYSLTLTFGSPLFERHLFLPVAVGAIFGLLFNFPMSRFVFRKAPVLEGPASLSGP